MIQWYEYTSGYNTKLQQPGYDSSTLAFLSHTKHTYWETFGWNFSKLEWSLTLIMFSEIYPLVPVSL